MRTTNCGKKKIGLYYKRRLWCSFNNYMIMTPVSCAEGSTVSMSKIH